MRHRPPDHQCFRSFNQAYCQLVVQALQLGQAHLPRGHACHELRPGYFCLEDARAGLYTGMTRRLNYRFLAVETLSYLAGWGDQRHAELMCTVNGNMANFVNPETGCFDGAYGPRLKKSLPGICELLTKDPYSRQCYASIWEPGNPWPSLDVPCTLGLHFYRDEDVESGQPTLSMSAYMRSNDLNWGTPYDVAAFCSIQIAMAACVGLNPGRYHHTAGSLHVYDATPPSVPPPDLERWLPGLTGPSLPCLALSPEDQVGIEELMQGADSMLNELYCHLVRRQAPARDFVSNLEVIKTGRWHLTSYWKQWADLVRFSWKEVQ